MVFVNLTITTFSIFFKRWANCFSPKFYEGQVLNYPHFPGFRDPFAGAASVDRTAHEKRSKRFFFLTSIYI